jgi:hypothetical protein
LQAKRSAPVGVRKLTGDQVRDSTSSHLNLSKEINPACSFSLPL